MIPNPQPSAPSGRHKRRNRRRSMLVALLVSLVLGFPIARALINVVHPTPHDDPTVMMWYEDFCTTLRNAKATAGSDAEFVAHVRAAYDRVGVDNLSHKNYLHDDIRHAVKFYCPKFGKYIDRIAP